jgi:HD-like signal output (HDOD) protein
MIQTPTTELRQLLSETHELPVLPQVAMRLGELTAGSGGSAQEIERIVAVDPGMAAKVLALANSTYYGMPKSISSLREAVMFLGSKALRELTSDCHNFTRFMGKSDPLSLSRRSVWRHSLETAICARFLATRIPAAQDSFSPEEAHTAGLLHDIGMVLLDCQRHETYVAIVERAAAENRRFSEVETEYLPFGHGLAAAAMANRWNYPAALCEAIAFHHTPRAAEVKPRLTAVIWLADEAAHYVEEARSGTANPEIFRVHFEDVLVPLRLELATVLSLVGQCRAEVDHDLSRLSLS